MPELGPATWDGAIRAAALLAVDPVRLGGVRLRASAGPVCEAWRRALAAMLPAAIPLLRVPAGVDDGRLLGGLDLAASLRAGRPIVQSGLLAAANGGILMISMAERLEPGAAGRIAEALDRGVVRLEREGLSREMPARFGLCLLDEGLEDEAPPPALLDRLALDLDLSALSVRDVEEPELAPETITAARQRLGAIGSGAGAIEEICEAAAALGIASVRAPLLALAAARANAALRQAEAVEPEDLEVAVCLVLAPRATRLPAPPESDETEAEAAADAAPEDNDAEPAPPPDDGTDSPDESPPEPPQAEPEESESGATSEASDAETEAGPAAEQLVEAALAALPPGVLDRMRDGAAPADARSVGRAGAETGRVRRGRPVGVTDFRPGNGDRLDLAATLRAAVPWQRLRERRPDAPVAVRAEDLKARRFKARTETSSLFAVDASGSTALARLAEAKGAVELLLADCYVRRDEVALIAFRGTSAEVLLPPTRSLVRAKRSLAGLPGGGGTPLGMGIAAALALAEGERRRGRTPHLVLMTDGKANIADDGRADRKRARADALDAARRLRAAGVDATLVDTSSRPQEPARHLAEAMGARYLALPRADAAALSQAVRTHPASRPVA